jgi:hypothetical protein
MEFSRTENQTMIAQAVRDLVRTRSAPQCHGVG